MKGLVGDSTGFLFTDSAGYRHTVLRTEEEGQPAEWTILDKPTPFASLEVMERVYGPVENITILRKNEISRAVQTIGRVSRKAGRLTDREVYSGEGN